MLLLLRKQQPGLLLLPLRQHGRVGDLRRDAGMMVEELVGRMSWAADPDIKVQNLSWAADPDTMRSGCLLGS